MIGRAFLGVGYLEWLGEGLGFGDGGEIEVQMFMRRTELSATTKLSAEHGTQPIANVLL